MNTSHFQVFLFVNKYTYLLILLALFFMYKSSKKKIKFDHKKKIKSLLNIRTIKYPAATKKRFTNIKIEEEKLINRTRNFIKDIIETTNCKYGDFWIAWWSLRDIVDIWYISNDIDIYSVNRKTFNILKEYFINSTKNGYILNNEQTLKFISLKWIIIDLVKLHYDNANICIANFDMSACKIACDWIKVYQHQNFFEDLGNRKIVFHKILYPEYSIDRVKRYKDKWFSITWNELEKLESMIDQTIIDNINQEYIVKFSIIKNWKIT